MPAAADQIGPTGQLPRTRNRWMTLGATIALAGLTACGGIRTKTVQLRAVDVDQQDRVVPCMYVLNEDWPDAEQANRQLLTRQENTLKLPFSPERNYVELKLVPLQDGDILEDGTLRVVPTAMEAPYMKADENPRVIRWTDPSNILFLFYRDYSR